jgi:hypothetical protein
MTNTNAGHTSQETHYVSATETNRLMLFGETVAVYCENHMEHIHCVGRMKSFSMLKQEVHIKTTGIWGVKSVLPGRSLKAPPQPSHSKIWSGVPWDTQPKITVLARASSNLEASQSVFNGLTPHPWNQIKYSKYHSFLYSEEIILDTILNVHAKVYMSLWRWSYRAETCRRFYWLNFLLNVPYTWPLSCSLTTTRVYFQHTGGARIAQSA